MKKIILSVLSFALLLSTTTIAYAAYNYVSPSVGSVGYNYAQMLTQLTGYRILDVDPHGYISYIVTISYDDLSSVCTTANGIGLSCSLYYNAYIDRYVIDVDDKALFGLTSTYGAIGNVDGNVLVAEADKTSETLDSILGILGGNNGGILFSLQRIESYLTGYCDKKLTSIKTNGELLNTKAAAIYSSLYTAVEQLTSSTGYLSSLDETLTSVVSEGMVKVDNSAVVSAIQAFPAFDDADIIAAIKAIPAFDDRAVIAAIKAIPAYDDEQLRTLVSSLDNYLARINSAVSFTRNDVGNILMYTSEIRDLIDGDILDYMGGMYSSLDYIRDDVKSLVKAYSPYDDTVLKNLVTSANTMVKEIATDTCDIRRYTNSAANSAFSIDVQLFNLSDTFTAMAADVNEGVGYLRNLCDNLGVSDNPGGSVDLSPIVSRLDTLIEKTSDTVVNVIGDNTYVPGVLYLDDDNGVVNTTKNGVSIFGDLLRWLWQNVFDGAFEAADITKLDGLFYDPTEVTTDGS